MLTKISALVATVLLAGVAFAQGSTSPAGLWETIDDNTGKPKSFVRISETNGVYSGNVEKIIDPAHNGDTCSRCTDERRDRPVRGMIIIRNVRGAGDGTWDGGDILDPQTGKIYSVKLKPIDSGRKLEVRGFIGIALLGRTQTWLRSE